MTEAESRARERAVVEVNELLGCYPDRIWRRKQIPDSQALRIWKRHGALRKKNWLIKPKEPVPSEMKTLTANLSEAIEDAIERRASVHVGFTMKDFGISITGSFTDDEWVLIKLKFL
jgi:uncharacterized membrane-anchored protein